MIYIKDSLAYILEDVDEKPINLVPIPTTWIQTRMRQGQW